MNKKILIISLDGGDWRFLKWANKYSKLNNIFGFKSKTILNSTIPAITPAAWASFQTGLNPGKTGIYDFSYWNLFKKEKKIISVGRLPVTVFKKLAKEGAEIGLVNLPLTYPPEKVGVKSVISGILTPSMRSGFAYPKFLKNDLLNQVPNYHIFNLSSIKDGRPHKQTKKFLNSMAEIVESRYLACKYLFSHFSYDLFMVHFQSNDVISHVSWGYLDPNHQLFDKNKAKLIAQEYYSRLDRTVGNLIAEFKKTQGVEDPLVLLVSDHGFEVHKKRINLGIWLAEEGYLELNKAHYSKNSFGFKLAKKVGLTSKEKAKQYFIWSNSQAFATGRSGEGFIYLLNKTIKEELVAKLEGLKDSQTGERVIKKVYAKTDIYQGEKLAEMPDLIVEPVSGYSCSSRPRSLKDLVFEPVTKKKDFHIGKHRKEGILAINRELKLEKERSILDIAPTIGYYLKSLDVDQFDGKRIEGIY